MTQLGNNLNNKTAVIGVVGLGYVGLPLAVAFAEAGYKVTGFDMQQEKVDLLSQGKSYIADVTSDRLSRVVTEDLLKTTSNIGDIGKADAICICVPTPLTKTKEPDLSYVIQVAEGLYPLIKSDQIIVLESTTYPGTTREIVLPILEKSGLKAGTDFHLAYSPERIDPANKQYSIRNTPKLVGGISPESTEICRLLYSQVADNVIPVSSPDVAEMAKVFENVYRSVNISLVNELARLCEVMKISVWEVIEAAASKPYGYVPFYPGPGIGGHCIPLDPYYLASKTREYDFQSRFIELAADINQRMPYHVARRIMEILNDAGKSIKDAKLLMLGIAYKKDVADTRESPAIKLIQILHDRGARIFYNDPYVNGIADMKGIAKYVELDEQSLSTADCVIIATDHSDYDYNFITDKAKLVYDTRGVTRHIHGDNIYRLGE